MTPLFLLLFGGLAWGREPYPAERLALVRDVTEARIAPDGRTVSFVSDITGALEVWSVGSRGGWPDQLSALAEQATDVRYSPDGLRLVFASDFGGNERPDLYLVDSEGGETQNITVSTRAETSPRFSPDGRRLAYLADPEQPFLFQLMVMDLTTRKSRQLTHETVNVHFPAWSPNGRLIAATRSGDDQKGELLLVDSETGETRSVAPPTAGGIIIPEQFDPLSRSLLCRARNEKGYLQLYLLEVATGQGNFIGYEEWDVDQAVSHPFAGIVFTRNEGGVSGLYRMKTPEAEPQQLLKARGRIEGFDLDRSGEKAVYLWSDSTHATDAWVLDLKTGLSVSVTKSMLGGVRPESLSRAEMINYKSFDSEHVEMLYLRPDNHRLGSPPPAVVFVHGGPDWQIYDDFNAERQALAEAGIAVIAPNFRGSTGFGKEFLDANQKDWGGGDRRDLIEAVKFLAKRHEIDPARVGITGGSYGGYMTLIALAKNKGEWAGGVEAYGMPDLVQDYELTKGRFGDWYQTQMGDPKAQEKLFYDRSAINFLDNIKAPLLIFQGANDTNVPKAESELVYSRLKALGRDVEMVVYSDEGHGFTKRGNRADYYKKTVEFFVKHLAPK
ncbi:MAG: S9 family peptidase [Elusimicrobia bacterium]|nr:S9 family peptidase [Elusimicrobiota bacterium]